MSAPIPLEHVAKLFQGALEYSLVLAPREPSLTLQELKEMGQRLGLKEGEMNDVLAHARNFAPDSRRILPDTGTLDMFLWREDPELRNYDALDFVLSELHEQMREVGGRIAQLGRDVVVARAVNKSIPQIDAEAAITLLVWSGQLDEKAGVLRSPRGTPYKMLPSQQRDQAGGGRQVYRREERAKAYPVVQDIVARRSDGRPSNAEPLDAFAEQIDRLGYHQFRLWWTQTVSELRQSQPQTTPVATCVLAAALVEGALTFVVRHARNTGSMVFRRVEFEREPRTWKIYDLVASAASGREGAILDNQMRARADHLVRTRQRIHAGRMLADYPAGPPDLRPEDARDAKVTADLMVRAILDWLIRFPPGTDS